ncbi:MAG: FHIPEP family type III secretion protein [Vampirovibrionia bacterium]
MPDMRYHYLVALSETTEPEDLEELLNEKARDGYELFMLHEVDGKNGKPQYSCIFYKLDDDKPTKEGENIEVTDITDFKKRMEKMYHSKDNYKEYTDIKQKIIDTKKAIEEAKSSLEKEESEKERAHLNDLIQEKISSLEELEKQLNKVSDAYKLYDRINADKITIYLSEELVNLTDKANKDNLIASIIKHRQDLADKFGFIIPNIRYSDNVTLEPNQYRIDIREVPAASGFVYPDSRMLHKGQSNITRKPRNAVLASDPIYSLDVYWIKEDDTKDYWDKGASASDIIAQHLCYTAVKYVVELLDYRDINNYIDIVRNENFDLPENLVPDVVSVGDLRYILANLIKEQVPIKDITFVFEKIMDSYTYAVEKELLLEKLRVALRRQITYSKADETNTVYSLVVDPAFDQYLEDQMIIPEHSNPFIELDKDQAEELLQVTAKLIEKANVRIDNTIIACSSKIRQALFSFYENYIPGISVLAFEEISEEVTLEEIGTLTKRSITKPKQRKQGT